MNVSGVSIILKERGILKHSKQKVSIKRNNLNMNERKSVLYANSNTSVKYPN